MAGQPGHEVDVFAYVVAALGRRAHLDVAAGFCHPTGDVAGHEPQVVEAVLQARWVEVGQAGAGQRAAFRQQHEVGGAAAGQLQAPALQVGVGDAAADPGGGREHPAGQQRIERHLGRREIARIAHLQGALHPVGEAIEIGGGGHQPHQAGGAGRHHGPATGVEGDGGTVDGEGSRGDRREGVGQHRDRGALARYHREARRQFDRDAGELGRCQGAQRQAARHRADAVAEAHLHQLVARLAHARGPAQFARLRVEAGPFGQAIDGERQRVVGIGIAARHREGQRLAEQRQVVGEAQHRQAVEVVHLHRHLEAVGGAGGIAHLEAQRVLAGLVVARNPFEQPAGRIEEGAGWQARERGVAQAVTVLIAAHQVEAEQRALLHAERRDARQLRRLVGLADAEREGFAAGAGPVRGGDGDVGVGAGLEQVRRPPEQAGAGIEAGSGRQVHGRPGHRIGLGIHGAQLQIERLALSQRAIPHRHQQGGGVRRAHHHGDGLLVATHRTGAAVAVVLHRKGERACADVIGARDPAEGADAVLRAFGQLGTGRQAADGEAQRILVGILGPQAEAQRFTHHSDLVADRRESGRFRRRFHRDHERARIAEHRPGSAAVAVVARPQRHRVVAAVAIAGPEHEGDTAVGLTAQRGERRQPFAAVGEGIAVGIGGGDRQFEHLALAEPHRSELGEQRWPVGVDHCDRHLHRAGERLAGAVAVVDGGEAHQVVARRQVVGGPAEQGGLRIERGPGGQARHRIGHGGFAPFELRERAVGQAHLG